jgi:hypothetical protein
MQLTNDFVSFVQRQEFLGMQAKYSALENRSKDLLLSQSTAVSGASVALSSLGNRLEHLVEQLISSYNISERDLEVKHIVLIKYLNMERCSKSITIKFDLSVHENDVNNNSTLHHRKNVFISRDVSDFDKQKQYKIYTWLRLAFPLCLLLFASLEKYSIPIQSCKTHFFLCYIV